MFCLFVFGHRYMGACDYFTYNGGEFYVNARMFHVQFCPLVVDQAVLKLPAMPDRGITITQVDGIHLRCFLWAALRSYTLVGAFIAFLIGLYIKFHAESNAWVFFILAIISGLVGILALVYKPKASTERVANYMDMIRPQLPPGNQPMENIKTTTAAAAAAAAAATATTTTTTTSSSSSHPRREGRGSSVIDMVRPLNPYQSLKNTSTTDELPRE